MDKEASIAPIIKQSFASIFCAPLELEDMLVTLECYDTRRVSKRPSSDPHVHSRGSR